MRTDFPYESRIQLKIASMKPGGGISPLDRLRLFKSFPVIVRRLVPITIIHIDTETVLIEEKCSSTRYDNGSVYRQVQTGRKEGALGNRVLLIHPEAGKDSTAHTERSFRRIGRPP